jgi:hypothetical protein
MDEIVGASVRTALTARPAALEAGVADRRGGAGLRFRTLVLGILLIWLSAHWIFWGELAKYTFVTIAVPFSHAVFLLLCLSLLNLALRKHAPALALTRLEMLAVYAMVSVGSAIMSADMQSILVTLMGYPTYFADGSNRWRELFSGVLPDWLIVTNRHALEGFYRGNSAPWTREVVFAWLGPILAWSLFLWALGLAMLCISVILRKAWAEQERLTFPIVALPLAMTEEPESFFKNRMMWVGFAIAGGITFVNGLNYLYPAIPSLPIKRQPFQLIAGGPLEEVSRVTVSFYFFAITLGFLMPLDLSFSLYLFYLLYKLQLACVATLGLPSESRAPYTDSQAFGAYVAVFCASVWRLKGHLRTVWQAAYGRRAPPDDANERGAYRRALAGLAASLLFLVGFALAAGMKPMIALTFLGLFLAISVMITRIRAEFGFPVHDMHQMGPAPALARTFGAASFDRGSLGMFSLFHWLSRAYRGHPMPHQLEALKMAGPERRAQGAMFTAVLVAGVVAVPLCFLVFLKGFYALGAATAHVNTWGTGYAREAFSQNLQNWLRSPARPLWGDRIATGAGFVVALLLLGIRRQFPGFPFHPLAYAVANSWGMANLWLPIMIGSWCKAAVLRGWGLKGYRRALMFFYGLMLGEFAVGCSWTLLGMALNTGMYEFWP